MSLKHLFYPGWATLPELFVPYLKDLAPGAAEAVDPGYFSPEPSSGPLSPGSVACGGPCVVYGCSMGSLHALAAAANPACGVQALVLFSGFARFAAASGYPGQPDRNIRSMRLGLRRDPELVLRNFYQSLAEPSGIRFNVPAQPNAQRLAEGLDILLSADLRGMLKDIHAPALVLHGGKDAVVGPAAAEFLADNLPAAELRLFPDAGHALVITHQRQCRELIRDFLAKHDLQN